MRWRWPLLAVLLIAMTYPVSATTIDSTVTWCIPPECVVELEVATNSAINITQESAILRGTLLSLGGATTVNVSFEWGPSPAMDFETDPEEMDDTGPFDTAVISLEEGTVYYFRAKAVGDTTAYGAMQSFETEAVSLLFDSLLPVGLAVAGFLIIIGLVAMTRRGGHTMGQLLVFIGGLALIFTGFDFQQSVGDAQIALMIAVAGLAVMTLSAVEMVRANRR